MARRPPKRQHVRKQADEARKKKIMSIVLAFLMIISLAGIFFGQQGLSQNNQFEYGDYEFESTVDQTSGQLFFVTEINDQEIPFYTLPQDAYRLVVTGNLQSFMNQAQVVVFSTDGNQSFAPVVDEIRFGLDVYANKFTATSTLEEIPGSTLPVLSCANATTTQAVIELEFGNRTQIQVQENGCAVMSVRQIDLPLFRDLLLYTALGVENING